MKFISALLVSLMLLLPVASGAVEFPAPLPNEKVVNYGLGQCASTYIVVIAYDLDGDPSDAERQDYHLVSDDTLFAVAIYGSDDNLANLFVLDPISKEVKVFTPENFYEAPGPCEVADILAAPTNTL